MEILEDHLSSRDLYRPGLDNTYEPVISAHFMHEINRNTELALYDDECFSNTLIKLPAETVIHQLLPDLLCASELFYQDRAVAAKARARKNYKLYGLGTPCDLRPEHVITEVMFDRQYLKGNKDFCSRALLSDRIATDINDARAIRMVIPALPFKFSSPLKSRGRLPDLAEIGFLLSLFEISKTIEILYREFIPTAQGTLSEFTVVSDGRRFNDFLNVPGSSVEDYQHSLRQWIRLLGLSEHVKIIDYQQLLTTSLPEEISLERDAVRERVVVQYSKIFWPIFDPNNIGESIRQAKKVEPDPESSNPDGRFVSLFKSLLYIVNYQVLADYCRQSGEDYKTIYREITRNFMAPYVELSQSEILELENFLETEAGSVSLPGKLAQKEFLRRKMLAEAWNATILYMAEIRCDRDLQKDPVSTCLPAHIRWTIHAKWGQLAILTSSVSGDAVQAWGGVGVFKLSKRGKIKLYVMPILALEGIGAIPVKVTTAESAHASIFSDDPFFYIFPDIEFKDTYQFLDQIKIRFIRKRKS